MPPCRVKRLGGGGNSEANSVSLCLGSSIESDVGWWTRRPNYRLLLSRFEKTRNRNLRRADRGPADDQDTPAGHMRRPHRCVSET